MPAFRGHCPTSVSGPHHVFFLKTLYMCGLQNEKPGALVFARARASCPFVLCVCVCARRRRLGTK
jgi:hypothetical protein